METLGHMTTTFCRDSKGLELQRHLLQC